MPWGLTTTIIPQWTGRRIGRIGERPFIVAGLGLHTAALVWLALVADPGVGYWAIAVPMVLSGSGIAMCLPAAQSAVLTAVEPRFVGTAAGAFSASRQLGGAFGVAVLVVAFTSAGDYTSRAAFADGFTVAILAGAGLAVAGALAGAVIPRKR